MSLIGNTLKPLGNSVLVPLRLTAAASATGATIHKKMFGSGRASDLALRVTTLIISNEKMKSLEELSLLIKGVSETIKNEAKEQKRGFLRTLLGTLGSSLLVNLLAGKGTIRAGEDTFRAGQNF